MSADTVAGLDAILNDMAAEDIAAKGGAPESSSALVSRVAKCLTPEKLAALGLSAGGAQLIKEWCEARAGVVPFRPRIVKAKEAGT
jgi:hypothetical protein